MVINDIVSSCLFYSLFFRFFCVAMGVGWAGLLKEVGSVREVREVGR